MLTPRRRFLQSAAGLAAGSVSASLAKPEAPLTLPTVKLGKYQISRMIMGENPFYGYSHFNRILDQAMAEWCTPAQISGILHRAEQQGINVWEFTHSDRSISDLKRFQADGGKLQWIMLSSRELEAHPERIPEFAKMGPIGMAHHGGVTDRLFRTGQSHKIREYLKRVRDTGLLCGMSTHNPDNVKRVEDENWDIDFFMTCCYNLTRTPDEIRQISREISLPASEVYLEKDPERMFSVVRQAKTTCFAFKILAAGRRIASAEEIDGAFRTAFRSIKEKDCVIVGMYPRYSDQVKENCDRVRRILQA